MSEILAQDQVTIIDYEDIKIISLSSSSQIFSYDSSGIITPAKITVTGVGQNTVISSYEFSVDGGAFSATYPSGVSLVDGNIEILSSAQIGRIIAIKALDSTGEVYDILSIAKVEDGYTPIKNIDYFDGTNGSSSYLWVKYSQSADGTGFTDNPAGAVYIGVATTVVQSAPTDKTGYKWSLIKGTDGLAGPIGPDGKTSYLHVKYSDNGTSFTANSGETVGIYIGTKIDFVEADSTIFSDYTWNKVRGDNGLDGYTIILTNESHTFAGDVSNAIAGSTTTGIIGYKGTVAQNITIGTLPTLPTGMTAVIANNGTQTPTIIFTVTTSFVSVNGTITIPITVDGKSFSKLFTYSIALKGATGNTGATGKGISAITNYFLATSAATGVTTSTSEWTTTPQITTSSNKYLWNYEIVKYTDTTTLSTSPCIIGVYGDTGSTGATGSAGANGTNGKSYVLIIEGGIRTVTFDSNGANPVPSQTAFSCKLYENNTLVTPASYTWSGNGLLSGSGSSATFTPTCATTFTANSNDYVSLTIVYAGISITQIAPIAITKVGTTGSTGATGATGKGISSTAITYISSTDGVNIPSGTWSIAIPTVPAGSFLWTRTIITYSDTTTSTSYSVGKVGVGIASVATEYSLSSSSTSSSGTWSATPPTYISGYYYWSRTKTTLTDGSIVYDNTNGVLDNGLNGAYAKVDNLVIGGTNLARSSKYFKSLSPYTVDNWYGPAQNPNVITVCIVRNDFWTGNENALEINVRHLDEGGSVGFHQRIPTVVGRKYTVSMVVAGHRSIKRIFVNTDANEVMIDDALNPDCYGGPDVNAWQSYKKTFTALATVTIVHFHITQVNSTAYGEDGYFWLKQWKFEEGDKASSWSPCPDDLESGISTAQTTADGKNSVYYQTSAPTGTLKVNDVWFDTDDGNKIYKYTATGWVAAQFGTNAIADLAITNALIADGTIQNAKIGSLDASKITTGYLSANRINAGSISAEKLSIGISNGGSFIKNNGFQYWDGIYPNHMAVWVGVDGGLQKVTVDNKNVIQSTCTTGAHTGFFLHNEFYAPGIDFNGIQYICIEYRFRLIAGTNPSGMCLLTDISRIDGSYDRIELYADTVGNSVISNEWYVARGIFEIPKYKKTFNGNCTGYLIFNSWGGSAVKTVQVSNINIYKATLQDYLAQSWTEAGTTTINGGKIDMASLFTSLNGATQTLKSSKIYVDADAQTLDLSFGTLKNTVATQGSMLSTQGTAITAIQGNISSKIWSTDITTAVNGISIGGRNLFYKALMEPGHWWSSGDSSTDHMRSNSSFVGEANKPYTITTQGMNINGVDLSLIVVPTDGTNSEIIVISSTQSRTFSFSKPWRFYFDPSIENMVSYASEVAKMVKIEKGSKATDWSPAPEDVSSEITTKTSEVKQALDEYKVTVANTYSTKGELTSVSTIATQTADKFNWLVASGTSASDFTITDRMATLTAEKININGLVTFSGLDASVKASLGKADSADTALTAICSDAGHTTINGDKITTGSIKSANYVENTSGTKFNLTDGTIDSKNFKVSSDGTITANNGKFNGVVTADSGRIGPLNITADSLWYYGQSGDQYSDATGIAINKDGITVKLQEYMIINRNSVEIKGDCINLIRKNENGVVVQGTYIDDSSVTTRNATFVNIDGASIKAISYKDANNIDILQPEVVSLYLPASITATTTNTTLVPFVIDTSKSIGSNMTVSNNAVIIGAGIRVVQINASLYFTSPSAAGPKQIYIYVNGTIVYKHIRRTAGTYEDIAVAALLNVTQGDVITIRYTPTAVGDVISNQTWDTFFQIAKVA